MFTVKRTGPTPREVAVAIRREVEVKVPLAVAKALTFTVQKAQKAVVAEMPRVFEGGATRYTLNATRIEPATPTKLAALLAVKDRSDSGNKPESYLFPEVYAGTRSEKRFERALRYAGLMQRGESAILSRTAPRDAYGNALRSQLQALLKAARSAPKAAPAAKGAGGAKGKAAGTQAPARKSPYFRGQLGGRSDLAAIFYADGGEAFPLFILTRKRPSYRRRLDFEAVTRETAQREFEPTLARLLQPKAR